MHGVSSLSRQECGTQQQHGHGDLVDGSPRTTRTDERFQMHEAVGDAQILHTCGGRWRASDSRKGVLQGPRWIPYHLMPCTSTCSEP